MKTEIKNQEELKMTIQQLVAEHGLTLRKIAHAVDLSYPKLLKASKQPVKGMVYDPEAINWEAIEVIGKEKAKEIGEFNWTELAEAGGKTVIVAKNIEEFIVGRKVYIRRSEKAYSIVWTTDTHIVIIEEGSTEPRSWGWETFLANGPRFEARAPKSDK